MMMRSSKRLWSPASAVAAAVVAVVAAALTSLVVFAQPTDPSLAAKQAYQARLDQARAADIASHTPAPKGVVPAPPAVQEPRDATGIYVTHQGWFSPTQFTITNAYHGPVAGDIYAYVFAGGKRVSPGGASTATLPALRVFQEQPNGRGGFDVKPFQSGEFVLPGGTTAKSALTILSVSGAVVELKAGDGSIAHFNLATGTWQ